MVITRVLRGREPVHQVICVFTRDPLCGTSHACLVVDWKESRCQSGRLMIR
jgi:hypothetical protein